MHLLVYRSLTFNALNYLNVSSGFWFFNVYVFNYFEK